MIETNDPYLEKILALIKERRNVDFSQYRGSILGRRVMARVRLTKRDNFEQYLAYLKFHPQELDLLMDTMNINVTEFFRDTKVFDAIEKKVIPDIIKKRTTLRLAYSRSGQAHDACRMTLNIWSCACSSGEEAYSVLMLIAEHLGTKLTEYKITINGTDIDSEALINAREGVYEAQQFRNLSPEKKKLIDRYFYDMGNKRYWIREEWSGYVDFQYHDCIADPPLKGMDMILCRNLFIYFDRNLQNQVLERFWQSLRKGGFLVLGVVESMIGPIRDKFFEYDRECRIYVKK